MVKFCSLDKDFRLIKILLLVVLIRVSCESESTEGRKLSVKKCCPKGQQLNSDLMCVNAARDSGDNKNNKTENSGKSNSYSTGNTTKIFFPDPLKDPFEKDADTLDWFPFDSILSTENLKQVTDLPALFALLTKSTFDYGKLPDCEPDERDWACFNQNDSKQFLLLLSPEQEIRLYVSKTSSYRKGGHFKVENRDCGYLKIDPEESNADRKEKGDFVVESLFKSNELRTFPFSDVCTDKGPNDSFLVQFCPCKTVPCVRKCCRDFEVFDEVQGKCSESLTFGNWRPNLENSSLPDDYYLLTGRYPSTCKQPRLLKIASRSPERNCRNPQYEEDRNKFHFLSDGSLKVKKFKEIIPARSYCGDHVLYNSSALLENNLLLCSEEDNSIPKYRINGSLFIVGGIVLLVTVSISLYLPELRTSVYSKVIICHNVSLMLAYFTWGSTYQLPFVTRNLCAVLGLTIQCTLLASFFWMNVMCLDISLNIRRFESVNGKVNDKQRFFVYLAYACGAPAVITAVTAAMEFVPSLPSRIVRPGFGCYNCGFDPESSAILIYVYGPLMAIILLDAMFYLLTIIQIIKVNRESCILDGENSSTKYIIRGKKRLIVFSKLFLFTGLSWIMEIIGWTVGEKDYPWYFPDVFNVLRAVFIFVIFTCKREIWESLMRKWKRGSESPEEKVSVQRKPISEMQLAEIKRRERILRKQITQTFRNSDESTL